MVGTGPAEFAFQATSGLSQLAQQLRAAAEQHSQFQQEMRLRGQDADLRQQEFANTKDQQGYQRQQQGFGNQLELLRSGARPVGPGGTMAGPATPGSQVMPGMLGVTMNAVDPGQVVTPPGGSQGYYMPTRAENDAADTQQRVGLQAALNRENQVSLDPAVNSRYGLQPGTRVPQQGYDTMMGHYMTGVDAANRVEDKPASKPTYNHFLTDAGNVGITRIGDDDTPTTWNGNAWVPLPAQNQLGPKRKDPDAAASGEPKPPTNAQLNTVENEKRVALVRAEAAFKKAMGNAKIGGYTDTDAAAQALADLHQAKQASQDAYEQRLQQYGVGTRHVEYGDEGSAAPPKQPAAAAPVQQQKPAAAAPVQQQQQKPAATAAPRQRAMNPKTKQIVEWDGKKWAPVTQ